MIDWHSKGSDHALQALGQIWRKSRWLKEDDVLPALARERLIVTEASWPLGQLNALLHEKQLTNRTPRLERQ